MVIIKFSVNGQHLKLETDLKDLQPTSDSYNYYKCLFEFDDTWEGFEKRVYFKNASFNITKPRIPDAAGYCYIPAEVLAHTGVLFCNVTGVKYSGTSVAERLTAGPVGFFVKNKKDSNPFDVFVQKEEGSLEPDDQSDLTPTEYEQFVGNVLSYSESAYDSKTKAEEALEEIQEILDDAFEEVIARISSITATAVQGEAGTAPEVTVMEVDDHLNLEFQIPVGESGVDGFSPYAELSKEDNTTTFSITDLNGTQTVEIYDGNDGESPEITANKVGKVTTIYVDGVAVATINDGKDGSGGGADVFIAEVGTTTYAEVDAAYNEGKILVAKYGVYHCPLVGVYPNATPKYYRFQTISGDSVERFDITINDDWSINQFIVASNAVATTTAKGLMSASDKTKLNGIAIGAEVNVQPDWNQTNTTADDYINNKPTIPQDKIFIAEKDVTTYAEVYEALRNGKIVFAVIAGIYGFDLYKYDWASANYFYFSRIHNLSTSPEIKGLKLDRYDDWTAESAPVPKDKIFIAEKDVTTYAEITAALDAGKTVFAKTSNSFGTFNLYEYALDNGTSYYFYRNHGGLQVNALTVDSTDTWSSGSTDLSNASNLTSGTLPVERLPVLFKITSTTSSATSLNYGVGKTIAITVPAQSGYNLVGVVGVTSNHGIASSIGGAWVSNATNRTVSVNITNRNTVATGNFTDLTVTVFCLWARSNIY